MSYEIRKYKNSDIKIDFINRKVYLSMDDISSLYSIDASNVSKKIRQLINSNKIQSTPTMVKFTNVAKDKKMREIIHYNFEIIENVLYKINPEITLDLKSWFSSQFEQNINQLELKESNIIRFNQNNLSLDVKIDPNAFTVYLTEDQMCQLFDRTRWVIARHINNIYEEKELDENQTCAKNAQVQIEGNKIVNRTIAYYNLDVVISVGYRVHSQNGILFRKWATSVLREYLLKGYVINKDRTLVTNENYLNLINKVDSLDNRVTTLEKSNLFITDKIIFEGDVFDALSLLEKLIESATKSITLIDPYVDIKTLSVFSIKNISVKLNIISVKEKCKLSESQVETFNEQYGGLTLLFDSRYHDRYLVIDEDRFYHLGSSVNYLGRKFSQISLIKDKEIENLLLNRIKSL